MLQWIASNITAVSPLADCLSHGELSTCSKRLMGTLERSKCQAALSGVQVHMHTKKVRKRKQEQGLELKKDDLGPSITLPMRDMNPEKESKECGFLYFFSHYLTCICISNWHERGKPGTTQSAQTLASPPHRLGIKPKFSPI